MYSLYIDGVLMPVTPSKITTTIKNQNKTINLINQGEVNVLKAVGLTAVSFDLLLPQVQYPFAQYTDGFETAEYYLNKLTALKSEKKPFQFIVSRVTAYDQLFDTNIKMAIEDFKIVEDSKNGLDIVVKLKLKQYVSYGVKKVNITIKQNKKVATVSTARAAKVTPTTYTVKSGDSLWGIAKKQLGDGSRYTEIYNLNSDKIANPNLIYPGQVLVMP